MNYLLDTNVYSIFFKPEKFRNDQEKKLYAVLQQQLKGTEGVVRFTLCEVTTLEIYSVLGKLARGKTIQILPCERWLRTNEKCQHEWREQFNRRLTKNQAQEIYQILKDIECQRGDTQAETWKLNESIMAESMILLRKYAGERDLHSLDSIIGGCVISAIKEGKKVTLVTLDTKFRNVMEAENVPCFKL